MECGNDLSLRPVKATTFGAEKLNFCVRYENRWILFAMITTMVYLTSVSTFLPVCFYLRSYGLSPLSPLSPAFGLLTPADVQYLCFFLNPKINNYTATSLTLFEYSALCFVNSFLLVKIIVFP